MKTTETTMQAQDEILFSGKDIDGTIIVAGVERRGRVVIQGDWSVTIEDAKGDRYQAPWSSLRELAYA